METVAPRGGRSQPSKYNGDDEYTSQSPESALSAVPCAVYQPLFLKTASSYFIYTILIFAVTHFNVVSAQPASSFSIQSTNYSSSNIITLGGAHVMTYPVRQIETGRLSLLPEFGQQASYNVGVAYYNQPVRLLDRSTNQSASFSTRFTFDVRLPDGQQGGGDGMTFVMSANNSYLGHWGPWFGIFDSSSFTPFKSIVVEFDTFQNSIDPFNDISNNHVSFDIMNVTGMAPANATDVSVNFTDETLPKYAWVDYSNHSQQLEVRVSNNNTKPMKPLSNYTVDLLDVVEEEMWVGFSSSIGGAFGNFYIGNWTFETVGIQGAPIHMPNSGPSAPPAPAPIPNAAPGSGKSGGSKVQPIILGGSLASFAFLLVCAVLLALCLWRRKSRGRNHLSDAIVSEGMPMRFTYKQLSSATKSFSEEMKLGQGGFGSVYRGVLPGVLSSVSIPVAVKKIKSDSNQGEKEFVAEVSIISRLRHRNLIQLQGYCHDAARKKYLLVYDLMPNGSLDKVLFEPGEGCLSWEQRLNIVKGTAAAVDYLHSGYKQQVIHRDIKSSNILLAEEFQAKLGDFGLARLVDHQRAAATTFVAGTYGYIAPEAAATGRFTEKTDVFAFGAVVLEIACGRKALSLDFPQEQWSLVDWVWQSLSESDLLRTVDKRLIDYDTYWMTGALIIGLWCSHPNPSARPSMRNVVQVLAGDAPVPSIPATKPAVVFSVDPPNITIDSLLGGRYMWGKSLGDSTSQSRSTSLVSMSKADSTEGTRNRRV